MVRSANISAIFGYHYGAGGGYTRARSCRTSRELIMHLKDARKRLCFTPMGCTGNNFSINFRPVKSTIFCQRISKGKLLFFANSGMIILTIRSLNGYQTPRNRLYTEPRCRIPCNGTTATAYTSATGAIDIAKRGCDYCSFAVRYSQRLTDHDWVIISTWNKKSPRNLWTIFRKMSTKLNIRRPF